MKTQRRAAYLARKEAARTLVLERLSFWNAQAGYGFAWKRVAIRDTRSRWGSCSAKGNLNFSYRIADLPPHLVDYIVVHELCHLGEFNHSPRFWALVARAIPDYAARRRELRSFDRSLRSVA